MPIYEYQCPKCQHTFEEWVKASESHGQEPCPKCGEPSPRIMSHTSFVLKGGGWYVSDYGYRKGVKEEGTASSSAPVSGSSGGDAGSAATSGAAKTDVASAGTGASASTTPTTGPAASAPSKAASAAS